MMVDLKGFEGKYKINECGNIVNKKGHPMGSALSSTGYLRVALEEKDSTSRKNRFVHRLVASTFIENDDPDNKTIVMHLDNDKLNNHVSNLRWGTYSDNAQQAHADKLVPPPPMKYTKHLHLYEIFNKDGDVVQCYGREELADKIQYKEISLKNMVGNGREIYLGPYKGYQIRRIEGEERIIKRVFIPIKEIRDKYKIPTTANSANC
jgi:hypothetical protein